MNHSINNLLWITLFAALYISSVNGCGAGSNGDAKCTDCNDRHVCGCFSCDSSVDYSGSGVQQCDPVVNYGIGGCGCMWTGNPSVSGNHCIAATCDPTIDPTIDPTSDPTVDPTIDPTQIPTEPTTGPTTDPTTSSESSDEGDDDDDDDSDDEGDDDESDD
eukprot:77271_1